MASMEANDRILLLVKREAFSAVADGTSYVNRPFTETEMALGLHAFVYWLAEARALALSDQVDRLQMHMGAPNESARMAARIYAYKVAGRSTVINEVKKRFPSFAPEREEHLAAYPVSPSSGEWADWEQCLTRVLILIVRNLAYQLVLHDSLDAIKRLSNDIDAILQISTLWVGECFGDQTAINLMLGLMVSLEGDYSPRVVRGVMGHTMEIAERHARASQARQSNPVTTSSRHSVSGPQSTAIEDPGCGCLVLMGALTVAGAATILELLV